MTDSTLEKNLKAFDYSEFSKVKESLLENLLRKHYIDNHIGKFSKSPQYFSDEIMTDEELDYAVAAGNPFTKTEDKK